MNTVDAVIVVRNHAATIAATLASLAQQRRPVRRVVVLDNGSSDGSPGIVQNFRDTLPLELVCFSENRGFAAAANEGVRRTNGTWVLSLNPDCRLDADFLDQLVSAAERSYAGAASGLLFRGLGEHLDATDVVDSAGMVVTAACRHFDRGAGMTMRGGWSRPEWVFGASGAAALYRRSALEDVAHAGGEVFDETFFAYREDADLAWRLQSRGWGCIFWPQARAWHARGLKPEANRHGTPEINRYSVRNRFLLRWGNADWRWHLVCFPWWLVRDVMVATACATVERSSLPGLVEAIALRRQHRSRGRANTRRATVSGWSVARWFLPGGHARTVERP
jgi:GT2 family glycosyltransferase